MTCEIKGLSAGVRYVSFDYIEGTASVDWSKVARVESAQLFVVKTESGTVYTGTLETTDTAAGRSVKIRGTTYQPSILPRDQQNLATALITAEAKFFRFSKTSLSASVALFPDISDPGRVRADTEASFVWNQFRAHLDLRPEVSTRRLGERWHHKVCAPSLPMPVSATHPRSEPNSKIRLTNQLHCNWYF